jgi:hypothetical protein
MNHIKLFEDGPKYTCRACGTQEMVIPGEVLSHKSYQSSRNNDLMLRNVNLVYDPTLKETTNYTCKNSSCPTFDKNFSGIKYAKVYGDTLSNYRCAVCFTSWNKNAI